MNQRTKVTHFFFQAEDGIRDRNVTGVQTCALPICRHGREPERAHGRHPVPLGDRGHVRSEERRVGKECRSRWTPNYYKKENTCSLVFRGARLFCSKLIPSRSRMSIM